MLDAFSQTLADDEYYAPLARVADPGPRFVPTDVPSGWVGSSWDIWSGWSAPQMPRVEQGWKIHVSARLERAQHVLDQVAAVCFAENVAFKHISARLFYLFLHHKHGPRTQSGKFCAIYPPDLVTARRLLDRLTDALADEEGAYVLTDRRYKDSRSVHYRYGSFTRRTRLRPDGTSDSLVRDGAGRDVVDVRRPAFVLPAGISDPFVSEEPARHQGPLRVRDYEIVRALRASNAGGAYQARDLRAGRTVFVKEARAHNGLTWDGVDARTRLRREYETLTALHRAAPGVCPEPLDHFTEWEHDFLVTEYVAGRSLDTWVTTTSPVGRADAPAQDFVGYYASCRSRRVGRRRDTPPGRRTGGHRAGEIRGTSPWRRGLPGRDLKPVQRRPGRRQRRRPARAQPSPGTPGRPTPHPRSSRPAVDKVAAGREAHMPGHADPTCPHDDSTRR